jgi:N-acetylmuramoyl-L-alanine amidase
MPKLVLDPGHGGRDPGAIGLGLKEAHVVLELSNRIAEQLRVFEVDMLLTRETDVFVTLEERARRSNQFGADYFVSVHNNSFRTEPPNGFETFRWNGPVSSRTVEWQGIVHAEIMNLLRPRGIVDRGLKKANLAVLRLTDAPAVLIEFLFISNPRENALLRAPGFLADLASAAAKGIAGAMGLSRRPEPDDGLILGRAAVQAEQMLAFARAVNVDFPEILPGLYLEIGHTYGVRGDIAFCQMLHETGFHRFGGDVRPDQFNYAGIGATGGGNPGARFVDEREGVTAHIQHLYAYASTDLVPEGETLVDPRFGFVARGVAPRWVDLNGRWAVPGTDYGQRILALFAELRMTPAPNGPEG